MLSFAYFCIYRRDLNLKPGYCSWESPQKKAVKFSIQSHHMMYTQYEWHAGAFVDQQCNVSCHLKGLTNVWTHHHC